MKKMILASSFLIVSAFVACTTVSAKENYIVNEENALNEYSTLQNTQVETPENPTVDPKCYNVAVKYVWDVGYGGNELEYTYNYTDYIKTGLTHFENIFFPNGPDTKNCDDLRYFRFRSYNTYTGLYSEDTTLESTKYEPGTVRYGRNCKYKLVSRFQYNRFSPDKNLPTDFDQEYCIWEHKSGFNHTIKATIAYNGYISDFDLWIPWIGYSTTSISLGNTEFELRSGPWKCSLRAKQSNIKGVEVQFGFGIE